MTMKVAIAILFVLALVHVPTCASSDEAEVVGVNYLRKRRRDNSIDIKVITDEATASANWRTRRTKQQKNVKAAKAADDGKKDKKGQDKKIPDIVVSGEAVRDERDSGTETPKDDSPGNDDGSDNDGSAPNDGNRTDKPNGDGSGSDGSNTDSPNDNTPDNNNNGSDNDGSAPDDGNRTDKPNGDGSGSDGSNTDSPNDDSPDNDNGSDNDGSAPNDENRTDAPNGDGSGSDGSNTDSPNDDTADNGTVTTVAPETVKTLPVIKYGLQESCKTVDSSRFNICLDLISESGQKEEWMDFFAAAIFRWEEVILGDLPDQSTDDFLSAIRTTITNAEEWITNFRGTGFPETIDDLYIKASMESIVEEDVLGYATYFPFYGDRTNALPVMGRMVFNAKDYGTNVPNTFTDTIIHEMGHVLGIGGLWNRSGLNDPYVNGGPCDNTYADGSSAQAEWRAIGCSGPLPVECIEGGEGTRGVHWDENCLKTEMMTGLSSPGEPSQLSTITIGTLKDLGYEVDFNAADNFTIANLGACSNFCPEATSRKRGLRPNDANHPQPTVSQEASEGIFVAAYKLITGNRALGVVALSSTWANLMSQGVSIEYLDKHNLDGAKVVWRYLTLGDAVAFLKTKDDEWLTANGIILADESS